MSVAAGPDIVEDGLVFCVDWSNPRCYQGAVGSEDWNDISLNPVATNGHHQSSGSGPTYVSSGSLAYFNYERDNTERHRNTWYHTVISRDDGDDGAAIIQMFLNGELKRTLTNGRCDVNYPDTNTTIQIGHGGSQTGAMDGDIAVVRVYNKQLTLAEVQQNYNAIKSRFGL